MITENNTIDLPHELKRTVLREQKRTKSLPPVITVLYEEGELIEEGRFYKTTSRNRNKNF
jgi:hypothetical protein